MTASVAQVWSPGFSRRGMRVGGAPAISTRWHWGYVHRLKPGLQTCYVSARFGQIIAKTT